MSTYIFSDIEDGTVFVNQGEYIDCLNGIRKCNTLLDAKYYWAGNECIKYISTKLLATLVGMPIIIN